MNILYKDGFLISHVCEKIIKYKPEFVITMMDNDLRFYRLKKYFQNNIKFIAIQNGVRGRFHDIFDNPLIHKDKNLSADYYFSFGTSLVSLLKKYIKVKIVPVGSVVNNMVKIKKFANNNKKDSIYIFHHIEISAIMRFLINQQMELLFTGETL